MRLITVRAALLATAVVSLAAPAAASATVTPTEISTALTKGVEYLKGLQKESGEIPGFGGDWALTSLAAAKVAPADVNKAGVEGKDARGWYEGLVGAPTWPGEGAVSTDFERGALLAYAAGIDPARVSKRQNLIAKVASYYQPESPGYYGSRPSTRPCSACWPWRGRRRPAAPGASPRSSSTWRSKPWKQTSTPTGVGPGKKRPATKRR